MSPKPFSVEDLYVCQRASTNSLAGPRPRGVPVVSVQHPSGGTRGRPCRPLCMCLGWPRWPPARGDILAHRRCRLSHSGFARRHCRGEPRGPGYSNTRRGDCRTPEAGIVTPTAKLASVGRLKRKPSAMPSREIFRHRFLPHMASRSRALRPSGEGTGPSVRALEHVGITSRFLAG